MIGSIISALALPIVNAIVGPFMELAKARINKEISEEELRAKMVIVLTSSVASVEQTHAQELTKSYTAFMAAAEKNALLSGVWAAVTISQLFVLLWHQIGIPFVAYAAGVSYPSSGSTVEWAYLLLGACIGLGPLVLRGGPGAMDADKWKTLIKK